jgi:hypothetical protein
MSSNDRMMKLDMKSLMSEVNTVIERHVHAAVMDFNTSRFNEDISKCSDKIQQLEEDLMCVTKDESTARTRIQETTYRINVSLIEQELVSYRENMQGMQEELKQLCQSHKNYDMQNGNDTPTDNIVLSINEVTASSLDEDNDTSLLQGICKEVQPVEKTNNIMEDEPLLGEDDICENLPEDEDEEDEEGVFEIEIDGVSYYTTGEENGSLYSIDVNGDPDVYVGNIQNGKANLTIT